MKASPGHGLVVRVENASLRRNKERMRKCVNYVQLGSDDNMPFFTRDKSANLCGDLTGYSYDVTNGQGVDQVGLSMLVTQYSKDLTQALRGIPKENQMILIGMFCFIKNWTLVSILVIPELIYRLVEYQCLYPE